MGKTMQLDSLLAKTGCGKGTHGGGGEILEMSLFIGIGVLCYSGGNVRMAESFGRASRIA